MTTGILVCARLCVLLLVLSTESTCSHLSSGLFEVFNLTFSVGVFGFTWISIIVLWFLKDLFQIPALAPQQGYSNTFLHTPVTHCDILVSAKTT